MAHAIMLHITINDHLDLMKYDKRTFVIAEISPCVREERILQGFWRGFSKTPACPAVPGLQPLEYN